MTRDYLAMLFLMIAAIAYAFGTWRRERLHGRIDALELREKELEALSDRLRAVEEERNAYMHQVSELSGKVAELRSLVMGEKVPPALIAAMTQVANAAEIRILSAFKEALQSLLEELRPMRKALETLAQNGREDGNSIQDPLR